MTTSLKYRCSTALTIHRLKTEEFNAYRIRRLADLYGALETRLAKAAAAQVVFLKFKCK
jgi:hypothetical protein